MKLDFVSRRSLRWQLGLAGASALVFWLQVADPEQAVGCWSILGAILFLALSYPAFFWSAITGIFGFEGGLLVGLLLGVESHTLWVAGGFLGAAALTGAERLRLQWTSREWQQKEPMRFQVVFREVGLGCLAGAVAAGTLRAEVLRLYLLGGLLVAIRLLLDEKRRQTRRRS